MVERRIQSLKRLGMHVDAGATQTRQCLGTFTGDLTKQRGDLKTMNDDEIVEGHLFISYQHGDVAKLLEIRHSHDFDITSNNHNCVSQAHTCLNVLHAVNKAVNFRNAIELSQGTPSIDKVGFISAPMRDEGCC